MSRSERLPAIDVLRGLVMVLMALDHARDYFAGFHANPEDLDTTTPVLFATRWVTHFCAPVFVFLAGLGAFLYGRSRTPAALSRYLLGRGLWLVVLELTLVRWAWFLSVTTHVWTLQVIAAIGVGMMALSVLVWLGPRACLAVGLLVVCGHNLLDAVPAPDTTTWFGRAWAVVHVRAFFTLGPNWVFIQYPVLPWFGVIACGYGFGTVIERPRAERRRLCVALGLALCVAFVALRALGGYGDPRGWEVRDSAVFTLLSFLNCEKYPPSLAYLLMTLGPAIAFLGLADREPGRIGGVLCTFGRVPLFYYVLHLVLLATGAGLMYLAADGHFWRLTDLFTVYPAPESYGRPLWTGYLAWVAVVALLYLPCRGYARLKARSTSPLLTYL